MTPERGNAFGRFPYFGVVLEYIFSYFSAQIVNEEKNMGKFEEVYAINVNDKTEKKGNLTYLSWAYAWAEFKKIYPEATYKVNEFDGTFCSGNEKMGYMVQTQVTAGEKTYEMWLPVMDVRNNAVLQPKMTEINKTIMRCLTKNLAMFGLGLYIYAGEDIPEARAIFRQSRKRSSPRFGACRTCKRRLNGTNASCKARFRGGATRIVKRCAVC